MATFKRTDLFVIVTDWFDNPFEDLVYTNLSEAKNLADEYNKSKGNYKDILNGITHISCEYADVVNLNDYASHIEDKASERASYD